MATAAGLRRVPVRFERRTAASDGAGNTVGAWARLCGPVMARLRPLKGREEVLQQRLAGRAPYELSVLSSTVTRQVLVQDRAVNDRTGEVYDISDIGNPDERNLEIVMLVQSGAASG